MEEIKVSVIIPVYNVEKYIRQCLESVTNQTLKDIEIIVVNDGTKDSSMKIAEEYLSDKRIKIINKENGGLSSARNAGMRIAQGKYICFIDSDDFIEKNMMEELYIAIEKTNCNVVESDIFLYDNKTHKIEERKNKKYLKVEKGLFLWEIYSVEVWNKIYRKNFLLENNIFFEEGIIHEDDLFSIKVLILTNRIKHIEKSFYYYRINRFGSITSNGNLKVKIYSLKKIIDKIREFQEIVLYDNFSFLMLKLLEIQYIIRICNINKQGIEKNKVREIEEEIKNNWKNLSEFEKIMLKNFLKKEIVNKKAFYNINLKNYFYWLNRIISFQGLKKIIITKILNNSFAERLK